MNFAVEQQALQQRWVKLDELHEEDKKEFLMHISSEDHEKTWLLLGKRVEDAEKKIIEITKNLKDEMHKDIKEASK